MPHKKPLISVIILNYNGKKLLEISIPSVLKQTFKNFELIIVDNGSTDDSFNFVESQVKPIKWVSNKTNTFSAGNNAGIRIASGDYILILNNDAELAEDCLEQIAAAINYYPADTGMFALKILNYFDRKKIDSVGLLIYPDGLSRGRGRLEEDTGQYDSKLEVIFPSGCAGVYKKTMLAQVGLFDEDFEFFVEDSDLGFRCRLAGWKCFFIPKAIAFHMYSITTGKYSPKKAFLVERNRLWLAVKLFPISTLLLNPWYSFKRYIYQAYGVINKQGAAGKFVTEFSGFRLLCILLKSWVVSAIFIPKMIKKRMQVNKSKYVYNKEIKLWFVKFGISARELSTKD